MLQDTVNYAGWDGCIRLRNDLVELVVTTQVGPRIIHFGFVGGENEFALFQEQLGQTGGQDWRIYGGHRLWLAPELIPRSYHPDNSPVQAQLLQETLCMTQPTETTTGIQKEMDIRLFPQAARVEITHRLWNHNLWAVEVSPWALTVMATGGVAILPLPPRAPHDVNYSPANTLTLWAYTDLSDPRFILTSRFVMLNQDERRPGDQKIGASVPDGWAAYARSGRLFVKRARYQPGAVYPDGGSSVEVYTNERMTELETLGPLARLEPGASVEHIETWDLVADVPRPESEADVLRWVVPAVQSLV